MIIDRNISLIGVCSGWGATNMGTAHGPQHVLDGFKSNSPFIPEYSSTSKLLVFHDWDNFESFYPLTGAEKEKRTEHVLNAVSVVANEVLEDLKQHKFPVVIGGDHSIAMGTWSAVHTWLQEDFGLIWIDAHLDAHTFETSPSYALHGMPVAALLGHGSPDFTHLLSKSPKIKPENIAFIGIRSFEEGEAHLLASLGVKIFDMDYVHTHGFDATFKEAQKWVLKNTQFYGITLDIDSLDPEDAPGTGTREPDGIAATDCINSLKGIFSDSRLVAFELTEFNPLEDQEKKTEKLIWNIMKHLSWRNT
jgi:arginase